MLNRLFIFVLLTSLSLSQVELSFGDYDHSTNSIDLYASSPYDIYGFQFNISSDALSLLSVSGGEAEAGAEGAVAGDAAATGKEGEAAKKDDKGKDQSGDKKQAGGDKKSPSEKKPQEKK